MYEILIRPGPKRVLTPIPAGINIQGVNAAGMTKSSGATVAADKITFTGGANVDWVRYPYAGTPDPFKKSPSVRITTRFKITNRPATYLTIWGRCSQALGDFGWQLIMASNGAIRLQNNTEGVWLKKVAVVGEVIEIMAERVKGFWTFYVNGVFDSTLISTADKDINADWMLGTYLNNIGQPIGNGAVSSPVNWELQGFQVISI